jgi:adenosylhomocysteine nucleosidase
MEQSSPELIEMMRESRMQHVAVVCAMESEAVHLRNRLEGAEEQPLARWRRTRGQIGDTQVDVIVCGIGLINAAAATATLCALERPDAILNYGCSGAHREDIQPGDVVIADSVVHISSMIVLPDGARRYSGFQYTLDGERVLADSIPAAPTLLALAQAAADELALPPWPGSDAAPTIHTGIVGSADIWTQHTDSIRDLHTLYGSLCEEMEAAAIAQVAAIHGIPFLAVKDISNNELREATDLSISAELGLAHIEDEVGKRAALLVERILLGSASGAMPPD